MPMISIATRLKGVSIRITFYRGILDTILFFTVCWHTSQDRQYLLTSPSAPGQLKFLKTLSFTLLIPRHPQRSGYHFIQGLKSGCRSIHHHRYIRILRASRAFNIPDDDILVGVKDAQRLEFITQVKHRQLDHYLLNHQRCVVYSCQQVALISQ
ncbi:hypothetical protein PoB_005179100 [Plakobranchus ocellatus]|uniref:Uncharacterized protein n=1 Tax=Plakobranchus ocellatus TaxID=259542 RepID=A0AAV4BPW9_9GAST|nr:hypothetical protein PoB_005179100 [Plakobranchus ocellatus]